MKSSFELLVESAVASLVELVKVSYQHCSNTFLSGRRGGSALGALIRPQNGAAIGALVGTILGAVIGSKVASCAVKKIGDLLSYGIVSKECVTCKAHFKIFIYKGEKDQNTCEYCEGTEDD